MKIKQCLIILPVHFVKKIYLLSRYSLKIKDMQYKLFSYASSNGFFAVVSIFSVYNYRLRNIEVFNVNMLF